MVKNDSTEGEGFDEDTALRAIVQGTATGTGEAFFTALVENLAKAMGVHGAWVTELDAEACRLNSFAFWLGGEWVEDYRYDIAGTPCEPVIDSVGLFRVPDTVVELYPNDPDLAPVGAVSYMGVPLLDTDGTILGHLAVLDTKPMPEDPRITNLFQIFAARAAAELQRLRAEQSVHEREEKLTRLVNGAMDAIVDLNGRLEVSLMNPSAETMLACKAKDVVGSSFTDFLTDESCETLDQLIEKLDEGDEKALWIPGGLQALRSDGEKLRAEATLSRSESGMRSYYSLILRDVNDRLEAEEKIERLMSEKELLERELDALKEHHEIIGRSKPMKKALQAVQQVGATDASVLLLGETGTGKELFARAIHEASPRKKNALIKVNCAAIPANLIESEFFGHEKGAFTGATSRRDGRFALADGGTIFLDEVGELPIDLQSKLLRVLQEGEFEPVGSGKTVKVDVRVVAATNRDLPYEIKECNFREDLYFRLNVFPIDIPPLRDRGNDIILIAERFVESLCLKMGRPEVKLSEQVKQCLLSQSWSGNVRELQNVLERALIMSRPGCLDLDRGISVEVESPCRELEMSQDGAILTVSQFQDLERSNAIRALEACGWKISGDDGAAVILGMKPSTLTSRLKVLGVERPK
jgi:PAS domain S-box-containing protein